MTVRLSLLLTIIAVVVAYRINVDMAKGLAMGSGAGILVFWMRAMRTEKLAKQSGGAVKYATLGWTFVHFAIYALALVRSAHVNRVTLHGLFGAIGGLLIVRIVMVVLGATGWDLEKEQD